jgi:hypothetical protein
VSIEGNTYGIHADKDRKAERLDDDHLKDSAQGSGAAAGIHERDMSTLAPGPTTYTVKEANAYDKYGQLGSGKSACTAAGGNSGGIAVFRGAANTVASWTMVTASARRPDARREMEGCSATSSAALPSSWRHRRVSGRTAGAAA